MTEANLNECWAPYLSHDTVEITHREQNDCTHAAGRNHEKMDQLPACMWEPLRGECVFCFSLSGKGFLFIEQLFLWALEETEIVFKNQHRYSKKCLNANLQTVYPQTIGHKQYTLWLKETVKCMTFANHRHAHQLSITPRPEMGRRVKPALNS